MGNWTVVGELGAGKTILSVGKIQEFLNDGKRVASNLDLYLEHLLPYWSKQTYTRLMDYPQLEELKALGFGSDSKREKTFGLLALDELSMWLNSHNWNAKGRDEFIVFQRHIRKRHWHTLFIAQDVESIDKQARNALVERVVRAGRTDRIKFPIFGSILRLFGFEGNLPQWHIGEVHYGKDPKSKIQDRWKYHGQSLWNAYNTDQEFFPGPRCEIWESYSREPRLTIDQDQKGNQQVTATHYTDLFEVEIEGCYTVLSPWHTKGRYLTWQEKYKKTVTFVILLVVAIFAIFALIYSWQTKPKTLICKKPDSYIFEGKHATISVKGIVSRWPVKDNKIITKNACYTLESKQ